MKILRLTNSSDTHPGVAAEQRSPAIAERRVAEALGEPVETMQRGIWPNANLPGLVERWMDQFQPDVVFVRLSSFWVAYESVPLRLERRLGPLGRPFATAGLRLGDTPWLIDRRLYKAGRRALTRTIGGDTHFSPVGAAAVLEDALRRVVAREWIVPAVRGTALVLNSPGTRAGLQRSKQRVAELNALVEAACARLRVPFDPEPLSASASRTRLDDDLHDSADAHARLGADDAAAILAAWRAAHS